MREIPVARGRHGGVTRTCTVLQCTCTVVHGAAPHSHTHPLAHPLTHSPTHPHTHLLTHSPTHPTHPHTHTHTHTNKHTHTNTHAQTHARTHAHLHCTPIKCSTSGTLEHALFWFTLLMNTLACILNPKAKPPIGHPKPAPSMEKQARAFAIVLNAVCCTAG